MNGIFIGFDQQGRAVRYKKTPFSGGEGHLFLSAPPRSGKARDILIPALLQYDEGSCIVIDPKGQLAAVTGPQRARMGQRVIILNPFGIQPDVLGPDGPKHFGGLTKAQKEGCIFDAKFNPLVGLDPSSPTFGADCDNIAESIVSHDGNDRDSHWSDSARGLVAGVIGHLSANLSSEKLKNLAYLRKIITSSLLLREVAAHAEAEAEAGGDPLIAEALARFREDDAANKGEVASIISTANTQTRFIGNRAIGENLSGSDFDFASLKQTPTTVYLVLPIRYLASCGKWFRLVLASALNALLTETPGRRVLCILDEFAQLGKLGIIENTLGLAAGMGVQLWPVLQDLTQLKDLYPNRWESFLGCAGVQMFFAPREYTSSEEISKLCGDLTISVPSSSSGTTVTPNPTTGETTISSTSSQSSSYQSRREQLAQDIRRMKNDQFILFVDSAPGMYLPAMRKPYWVMNCGRLASPDPYHVANPAQAALPAAPRLLTAGTPPLDSENRGRY